MVIWKARRRPGPRGRWYLSVVRMEQKSLTNSPKGVLAWLCWLGLRLKRRLPVQPAQVGAGKGAGPSAS